MGFSDWQLLNNSVFNHRGKIGIQTYDKEQVIRLEDIIDLTNQVDSLGRLNWEAPLGNWTVIRLGHTSTGRKTVQLRIQAWGLNAISLANRRFSFILIK